MGAPPDSAISEVLGEEFERVDVDPAQSDDADHPVSSVPSIDDQVQPSDIAYEVPTSAIVAQTDESMEVSSAVIVDVSSAVLQPEKPPPKPAAQFCLGCRKSFTPTAVSLGGSGCPDCRKLLEEVDSDTTSPIVEVNKPGNNFEARIRRGEVRIIYYMSMDRDLYVRFLCVR